MGGCDPKVLTHKSCGSPVGHGNQTSRTEHAQELRGYRLRTRSKQRAEHADDGIERTIRKLELLGITLFKRCFYTFFGGARASLLKQVGCNVHSSNDSSGSGFRNGGVARTAGNIKNTSPRSRDQVGN